MPTSSKGEVVVSKMFTDEQYRDMHFVCGFCNGNAAAAGREYRTTFPQRQHPKRRVFEALHRRMGDEGMPQSTHRIGRPRNNVTSSSLNSLNSPGEPPKH